MKSKLIGYIISGAGLVLLVISLGLFKVDIPLFEKLKPIYIVISALVLIILGVTFALKDKEKTEQKEKEVPIYEVKGKHRNIVGYRREK